MKETVFISIISIIYLVLSFFVHQLMLKKGKIYFAIIAILYLLGIWGYVELIRQVELVFRDHGFSFEFGHADILMIEVSFIYILLGILNVLVAIVRRATKTDK